MPQGSRFCDFGSYRLSLTGRTEEELDDVVLPQRRVDHDLRGNDRVLGMQKERLLGRQMPFIAEAVLTIAGAKLPEGGVPSGAVPLARARGF